jgi:hypothetical protein
MIKVIGLSGKAGSGKDFIASRIITPKYGYVPFSIAWHVKANLVGKGVLTYEEAFITKPPHARHLLQQEATESGRDVYGPDMWLRAADSWMRTIYESWGIQRFVLPDVRFPNEVEYIKKMGGRVFRIVAPTRVAQSPLSEEAKQHYSEVALDDYPLDKFDGIIHNDIGQEDNLVSHIQQLNII